jgi:hypothetical protein
MLTAHVQIQPLRFAKAASPRMRNTKPSPWKHIENTSTEVGDNSEQVPPLHALTRHLAFAPIKYDSACARA